VSRLLAFECSRDVVADVVGLGDGGEPQLPEAPIRDGGSNAVAVLERQRLEANAVTF
jgi:hypothetical protein